jgi:hypothetical protein
VRCFGHIHLSEGVTSFRADRTRERTAFRTIDGRARPGPGRIPSLSEITLQQGLTELQRAEARLPHVSRGYFVTRWKSHQLPPAGQEREQLVQQLVEAGLAEEFELTSADGRIVTAIRSRNGHEPSGAPSAPAPPPPA